MGVLVGLLIAGGLFLITRPPRGEPVRLLPPPTSSPLTVHVSGAVSNPGIYTLPPGSRIYQAIEAAGGLLMEANPDSLNLAAPLEDGQRIFVPNLLAVQTTTQPGEPGSSPQFNLPSRASTGLININTASAGELESLPGIGPALAQRIIEYREANGPFSSIAAIQDVNGIGPAKFDGFKDLITVEGFN